MIRALIRPGSRVLTMRENNYIIPPREAAKFICDNSVNVNILPSGVKKVSEKLFEIVIKSREEVSVDRWKTHELLPQSKDDFALNWVFVSDLLNFSFWTEPDKKYIVNYKGKSLSGYWSLCAAMWRSIEEGLDITDPHVYSHLDFEKVQHIFRSDSNYEIPLIRERLLCLQSAGKVLIEKYNGSFRNVLQSCCSATELLEKIVTEFESFRDEVTFNGKRLAIYKRAQILVGDVWACFGGEGTCKFDDIDEITAFADYRVPQVLVWLGALKYSKELQELLDREHMFNYEDQMEIEIRGATIHCVDLIVLETNKLIKSHPDLRDIKLNSITVDHYLWDLRREKEDEIKNIPFHKTRSIYY